MKRRFTLDRNYEALRECQEKSSLRRDIGGGVWQHCAAILHVGLYDHCYGLGFSANANEVCNNINRLEVLSAAFLNVMMSRTFVAQRGTMMKNRRVSGVRSVLVELVSSVPSNTQGLA